MRTNGFSGTRMMRGQKLKGLWLLAGALWLGAPMAAAAAAEAAAQDQGGLDDAGSFMADAEAACRHGDFSTFLFSFAADDGVQQKYSAPEIAFASVDERETRAVALDQYLDLSSFPLRPLDMRYFTRPSVDTMRGHHGSAQDLVGVELTIDDSKPNQRTIAWVTGRHLPAPEEEGPGDIFERTGGGGVLTFMRTPDCWQLVSDVRRMDMSE